MGLADEELLRIARQQPEAAGVFWERFERPTFAFFRRRVTDAQTAVDLTSETFVQAVIECSKDVRVDDAASWLFAIAKGRLAEFKRREAVAGSATSRRGAPEDLPAMEVDLALLAVASVLRGLPPHRPTFVFRSPR